MLIAKSFYGKKARHGVQRLSEGKYQIAGRIVFVRVSEIRSEAANMFPFLTFDFASASTKSMSHSPSFGAVIFFPHSRHAYNKQRLSNLSNYHGAHLLRRNIIGADGEQWSALSTSCSNEMTIRGQ